MNARILPALVVGAAVLAAATPVTASETRSKAPNFRAVDLQGNRFQLEDLLGKGPIVVDFWATWCKPCLKELPYVQRILEEHQDEGLVVLAVTIDSPKYQSQVGRKMKGYDFRVVLDPEQEVFRKLQGKGDIPYVVVIDRDGFIRYQHTGYRPGDEKELEKVVADLLAESNDAPPGEEPEEGVVNEAG